MKKKLISSITAAATALSAMAAFTCTGYAEDELFRVISVPMESIEGTANLIIDGGGYFNCETEEGEEENVIVYISDDAIDNWRQTGEFTYSKIESDLGINAEVISGGFWFGSKAVIRDIDTDTYYLTEFSEDGTTFVTLMENDGWYTADTRGYRVYASREDTTFYYTIEKPDGSSVSGEANGEPDENNAMVQLSISYNGDYIFLYTISEKSEQTDDGWVYTYGIYGVDENGTATKLSEVENAVSTYWRDDCDYLINENFTLTDGTVTRLYVDMSGRLITVDASTVIPEIPEYALNRVFSIFGDAAILEYIGEDENNLRYVLCEIGEDGSFSLLNDKVYTYIQAMNGFCYNWGEFSDNTEALLFERDGVWGYVSKNGEEIATFDDATTFVDSEYTPVYQDGKYYLIDKQMNRVSEYMDWDFANSLGSELFVFTKDGVRYLATYVAPGDGAYDSAASTADAPDESKGNPETGVVCAAAPILAGAVLTAALTRKRR
ncbi:MAG: WG repeat-containing protein [Ruminiclostridium sp.]